MEFTAVQRITAFVAVVLALAGLAAYLFLPPAAGAGQVAAGRGRAGPSPGAQVGGRPAASPGLPGGPGGSGGPSGAPGTPGTQPPGAGSGAVPDIYAWLPFTRADLASAARVATEFGADYGTYSYARPVAAYLAPMRPIVTSQLAALLGRAYATPGVAAIRQADRQQSAATAAITALRAFGPSSLTFVLAITERVTSTRGTTTHVADYAVTLTGSGARWQVSDIQPATAGNQ
jgi:hypothetical protein